MSTFGSYKFKIYMRKHVHMHLHMCSHTLLYEYKHMLTLTRRHASGQEKHKYMEKAPHTRLRTNKSRYKHTLVKYSLSHHKQASKQTNKQESIQTSD